MRDPFSSEHQVEAEVAFDPSAAAVLVIDMLNDFLEDGGKMMMAEGRALYGPISEVTSAAHSAGVPVIWVCDRHPEFDREFEKRTPHCLEGTWGAEIVGALDPQPEDYRIYKRRFSGFFETDLDLRLRDLQISHLITVGIATNICVRATVEDAFFRNYRVLVPEDCVGATNPQAQESTLFDIATHFGTLCHRRQVIEILNTQGREN